MHIFHWAVVALSVLLTISAWWITKSQYEDKIRTQFLRETQQVHDQLRERMTKYEDALWAGVSMIQANGGTTDVVKWRTYETGLGIEKKYPGINGIGVIFRVQREDKTAFLGEQRAIRPSFAIYPTHEHPTLYPITYIEPLAHNKTAVGLDIAFEVNRRTALEKSIASGTANLTAPIVLVQDKKKTPGFLFYAPYYQGPSPTTQKARKDSFAGAVYAPFIVTKLIQGTLQETNRHVTLHIADGPDTLYDEHGKHYDDDPLFTTTIEIAFYGRTWRVDMQTNTLFRTAAQSSQSTAILIGGIAIDTLLLVLFLLLTRSKRRTVEYADEATADLLVLNRDLTASQASLQRSNAELEQFAYVASHDLQEPIRMVRSYSELLLGDLAEVLDEQQVKDFGYLMEGATRMQSLVSDLLAYSRVDSKQRPFSPQQIDLQNALNIVLHDLTMAIDESGANISIEGADIPILGDPSQFGQVLQNLLSNAIKFRKPHSVPVIHIRAEMVSTNQTLVSVSDNGVGIPEDMHSRIFQIFQRLHTRQEYDGTGLGLAIVKKIVERHGGTISVESTLGEGSCFQFTMHTEIVE